MKRVALGLLALILLRADMYPDASNAKRPEALDNLGLGTAATPNFSALKLNEPRCAIYDDDGKTPKSYRQECLIAVLVAAVGQQRREIAELRRGVK